MFTGIVQDIGEIAAIDKQGDWVLGIVTRLPVERMSEGASIACNGVCLTVIEKSAANASGNANSFKVQVSAETLSRTTALHWRTGHRLNLEPALRMGDELGGHIVSGHIDGLARVVDKSKDGDSLRFVFEVPDEFARFVAEKGSVALDGVSLTVNEVEGPRFGVNIIPFTQKVTTFGTLELNSEVNFEVDTLARYAARLMNAPRI
jgi:riboflavin synthase